MREIRKERVFTIKDKEGMNLRKREWMRERE